MTPFTRIAAVARLARSPPEMTIDGPLRLVFIVAVVLSVLLGLATAVLAVYRYRQRGDPALRALVVGLVLVAVAPLPFRVFVAGTIPPTVRLLGPAAFQTAGLIAILWAMYGDPRSDARFGVRRPTTADLVVVTGSVAAAATSVFVGGNWESRLGVLVVAGSVAALATFVAFQAARAAYRYRSPTMASLSVGIFLLAALPVPVGSVLVAIEFLPDAVVVATVLGAILLGEMAMFVTLAYR